MAIKGMSPYMVETARWSVMWVRDDGKIVEKKTGTDLDEALRLFALAVRADKRGLTLRCCNIGHSPPKKYTHRVRVTHVRRRVKRGPRQGEYVTVRRETEENVMGKLNDQGIWWCPYCRKMRRFYIEKSRREVLMKCPMCHISSRDFHVRYWNPKATVIEYHRRTRGKRRGRRRRT